MHDLPHASSRTSHWIDVWRNSSRLVLLLDFDGTLAPIVDRPELAGMHPRSRKAIQQILERSDADIAIVSGRGLADARALARLDGVAFAGNHGMEIEVGGESEIHTEAAAARPDLERVAAELKTRLSGVAGSIIEDKGLTLSVHFRLVQPSEHDRVRREVAATVQAFPRLKTTAGKMVLEIRPNVDWHKGKAVEFLLDHFRPPSGAQILYIGDDRTDEDAFRALNQRSEPESEGVLVADQPSPTTAARSWVRSPDEVAELLETLAAA